MQGGPHPSCVSVWSQCKYPKYDAMEIHLFMIHNTGNPANLANPGNQALERMLQQEYIEWFLHAASTAQTSVAKMRFSVKWLQAVYSRRKSSSSQLSFADIALQRFEKAKIKFINRNQLFAADFAILVAAYRFCCGFVN